MAKQGKVNRKNKGSRDVTIYDFANSAVSTNRPKKSEISITTVVKNELEIKENWYDDDIDEECTSNQFKKKEKNKKIMESNDSGVNYPVDVWFLISDHIAPEEVGRFAAICQASLAVVQSVQFWKSLYKRYYKKECLTPEFQPECLLRHFGLRTAVIRALFLMYPPFTKRIKKSLMGVTHPDAIIGMTCVGLTSKTNGKTANQTLYYYFKFKRSNNLMVSDQPNKTKEQSVIDLLNDISANADKDHCILLAVSTEQISFPPILGQTLKHASLSLSKGLCNDKLQLVFGHPLENYSSRGSLVNGNTIVLDPVTNVSILNWWDPMYIRNNSVPSLDEDL